MNLEAHTLMYMHKVEKALSMPHRYPVFAQDAIKELVKALENPEVSQNIVEQIYITLAKYNQSLDLSYPENQSMVNWLQLVFLEKNSVSDGAKKTVNNNYMVSNEQNYLALHNIALNRHSTRNF